MARANKLTVKIVDNATRVLYLAAELAGRIPISITTKPDGMVSVWFGVNEEDDDDDDCSLDDDIRAAAGDWEQDIRSDWDE